MNPEQVADPPIDPSLFAGGMPMEPTKAGASYIRFHRELVEDKLRSWGGVIPGEDGKDIKVSGEGRPMFDEVDFIEIRTPGDTFNIIDRPVSSQDLRQYGKQYADWKKGVAQASTGTPVAAIVGPMRAKELEYFGVRTVEQYADVSDGNLQKMGLNCNAERQRCRDFMETAKGNAPVATLRSQLEARDTQLAALQQQVKELNERLDAQAKPKKSA